MVERSTGEPDCFLVGIDNSECSHRALSFACQRAQVVGARVVVVYVVEWSPFSFNTPEENEQRHKRREEEISLAKSRVLDPSLDELKKAGINAEGMVRHGNVADVLDGLSSDLKATQIVVGRVGDSGLKALIFGSVTSKLIQVARVPVTVVP